MQADFFDYLPDCLQVQVFRALSVRDTVRYAMTCHRLLKLYRTVIFKDVQLEVRLLQCIHHFKASTHTVALAEFLGVHRVVEECNVFQTKRQRESLERVRQWKTTYQSLHFGEYGPRVNFELVMQSLLEEHEKTYILVRDGSFSEVQCFLYCLRLRGDFREECQMVLTELQAVLKGAIDGRRKEVLGMLRALDYKIESSPYFLRWLFENEETAAFGQECFPLGLFAGRQDVEFLIRHLYSEGTLVSHMPVLLTLFHKQATISTSLQLCVSHSDMQSFVEVLRYLIMHKEYSTIKETAWSLAGPHPCWSWFFQTLTQAAQGLSLTTGSEISRHLQIGPTVKDPPVLSLKVDKIPIVINKRIQDLKQLATRSADIGQFNESMPTGDVPRRKKPTIFRSSLPRRNKPPQD